MLHLNLDDKELEIIYGLLADAIKKSTKKKLDKLKTIHNKFVIAQLHEDDYDYENE